MIKRTLRQLGKKPAPWVRGLVALAGAALVLAAISCRTVTRSVVVLPNVPGANYIGSSECELCHDEIYRDFAWCMA